MKNDLLLKQAILSWSCKRWIKDKILVTIFIWDSFRLRVKEFHETCDEFS